MAIKRIRANYHNGTEYDTHHYETQANQVLIMSGSGVPISTIEEALLEGKLVKNGNLNTLINTGLYQISGGTNLPSGMDATKSYLMAVKTTGVITHQEFVDHIKNDVHSRTIDGSTVGAWVVTGKSTADSIKSILTSIGSLTSLKTVVKTSVVSSINEVVENLAKTNTELDKVSDRVGVLEKHNHDDAYLKTSGGKLTGKVSMAHGGHYAGEDSGGSQLNIGAIDNLNRVSLGDQRAKAIIWSDDANLEVSDGVKAYRVYHSGNMGANSGLDADKLDGLQASAFAQLDKVNVFSESQVIKDGEHLYLNAIQGTTNTGNVVFRDYQNRHLAYLGADESGSLHLKAGSSVAFKVLSSGSTETEYNHILNAKNRETRLIFKNNNNDAGVGLAIDSGDLALYDWENGKSVWRVKRDEGVMVFPNYVYINNKKFSITSSAPSNPNAGDIWIDI